MAHRSEIPPLSSHSELHTYSRLRAQSLETVVQGRRAINEDVSYRFSDGSELLDFIKINSRRDSPDFRFENDRLEAQFLLMDSGAHTELEGDDFALVRKYLLPIAALSNDLVTHHIPRSRSFESKVKTRDLAAREAARTLTELDAEYDFGDEIIGIQEVVDRVTDEQKTMRTTHLLNDFERSMADLRSASIDVWLKLPSYTGDTTKAAHLSRFAIHYSKTHGAAVEPVIEARSGAVGLIPNSLYVAPSVQLRVGSKHTRLRSSS